MLFIKLCMRKLLNVQGLSLRGAQRRGNPFSITIILSIEKNVCYNIFRRKKMTNEKALKALRQIKTYCAPTQLEELDYAIEVLEKLEKDGIKEPLTIDFKDFIKG